MMKRVEILAAVGLTMASLFFAVCIKDRSAPVEPEEPWKPYDHPELAEDTTRVWLTTRGDTLHIYPKALVAYFYPWIQDTNEVWALLDKHHLRPLTNRVSSLLKDRKLTLCVTDDRRAEYHFTPYGRPDFENFGSDSLVEYAFGVFNKGYGYYNGTIMLRFEDHLSQTTIDSFFVANGLRFLYTYQDYPSGTKYYTFITPRAPRNLLDLAIELLAHPLVLKCSTGYTCFLNYQIICE